MSANSVSVALAQLDAIGKSPERIAARAVGKIAEIIDTQFAAGVDPNGEAWAPLRPETLRKGRRPPPLTDTGAMAGGAQVTANGDTLTARIDEPADYHQSGTASMARRPILPDNELPRSWEAALQEAADEVTRA